MRPLIIAEAANPEWSSVPLVGWSQAEALLRRTDAHLVTQVRNRDAILRSGLEPARVTFIDTERLAAPAWRFSERLAGTKGKAWTVITAIQSLTYPFFEWMVERRFGAALERGDFDLVHRLTPLSPTAPSPISRTCARLGIPFILGPLNGGTPWPPEHPELMGQEREWLTKVRSLYRHMPGARSTRVRAAAIILASRAAFDDEDPRLADRCFYMPENGIDPTRFPPPSSRSSKTPLRFLFVGRLVPFKGLHIALEAIAPFVRDGLATMEVAGDGPAREDLQEQAHALGLRDRVVFHGWVPHQEVGEFMGQADVFLFPSLREFGGGVVLEAMAMGAVPLIVDYGGPGELVDARTGVKVPMQARAPLVNALRREIASFLESPEKLDALRQSGVHHVRETFAWDAKATRLVELYAWTLGRGPKPAWTRPPDPVQPSSP